MIQCAMVAALYWPQPETGNADNTEVLLPIDPDSIDEIYIGDEQEHEAVLLKMAGQWLLPDLAGMPIDESMVTALLAALSDTRNARAVALTDSSRQRFEVADYHYQRRISLIGDGELLGTIYLGASPGFRKVYARNSVQDAIYSIEFSNHNAPASPGAWLDRALLQIPAPDKISSPNFSLTRTGQDWYTAQNEPADERELAALLLGLSSIQVDGIADDDMQQSLAIAAPEVQLEIESRDGSSNLILYNIGTRYYARSNKFDAFFTLSAYDYDRLSTIDPAALGSQ